MKRCRSFWIRVGIVFVFHCRWAGRAEDAFEREPISYSITRPKDRVQAIEGRMASGDLRLEGDDRSILRQLLALLDIPEESQLLVFSRTSFQNDLIRPEHPRALYFGDTAYVGWVPGGLMEVAVMSPTLGPVFYSFDPHPPKEPKVRFVRNDDCLRCHGGTFIRDIPAILARSVYTDTRGYPVLTWGSELVGDTTPLDLRWGGWYVTGRAGNVRHRGNLTITGETLPSIAQLHQASDRTNLDSFFDSSGYLSASSDIVALMVFEHQLTVHNALTQADQHCRWMMHYQEGLQRSFKETITDKPVYESVIHAFEHSAERILDALLFKDAAQFPSGGIQGGKTFADAFLMRGPTDQADPRVSLRSLDLKSRLFRWRCSYVISTPVFDSIQPHLRATVLKRLDHILREPGSEPRYAYLEPEERTMIRAILKPILVH